MAKIEKSTLYCNFCGNSQHEVSKLIAGPTVFICDECVNICNDIIAEAAGQASEVHVDDELKVPRKMLDIPVTYPAFQRVVRVLESQSRINWGKVLPKELLRSAVQIFSRDIMGQRQDLDRQILEFKKRRTEVS